MKSIPVIFSLLFFLWSCKGAYNPPSSLNDTSVDLVMQQLNLPQGFQISVYADEIENARSMAIGDKGTVFVGNRGGDKVYALIDKDGDFKVDDRFVIFKDGNMPNGVAFHEGDLYVAEVNRILKFENIEDRLGNPPEPIVIFDKYPTKKHHGWKYIEFGPDGKLYVPVGAPCNICESEDEIFNTITRINKDGTGMEIVHSGIRNTVGFTWHPTTKELWFTDNGGDNMGDDIPACELNVAKSDNQHYGYPYCHQGDILDETYGVDKNCEDYQPPVQKLGAHVAPLGVKFYAGNMFPDSYKLSKAFIAEHGSWNRSKKSGYRISIVNFDKDFNALSYEPFIDGWLNDETQDVSGRPVDIEWLPDGSMLISDDFADRIYRVTYVNDK